VNLYLPDASVFLKWQLHENEPYQKQALELRDRYFKGECRLVFLEFAALEIANRFSRLPHLGRGELADFISFLPKPKPLTARLVIESFELARQARPHKPLSKISLYDCLYISEALREGAMLISADEIQLEAARLFGCLCTHLKDFQ